MKKVIPGLICLLLISSCGFETPQSITIKGEPGLYVPLGSPFEHEKYKGKKLEDLISPESIKTMIKASKEVNEVYEIDPAKAGITTDALTYLVEYQLADKKLDLQKQMDEAMEAINSEGVNIPSVPTGVPVSSTNPLFIDEDGNLNRNEIASKPFLRIPLNEMVTFVKEVTRKPDQRFGLKIPKNENIYRLKDNLRLRIPALGITYDTPGTLDSEDNLLFVDTTTTTSTFYPREKLYNGLLIYARITGDCGEGIIKPEIVFEWDEAVIDTLGDSAIHEEFSNENKSLEKFLGGAAAFKQVLGYVYIYGMDSPDVINMTVTFNDETSTRNLLFIDEPTGFAAGNLFPSSFYDNVNPLDMTDFFNNKENKNLGVDINIPELRIYRDEHLNKTIQCKLCVLIPLDLKVSEVNGGAPNKIIDGVNINNTYVPLELGDNFNFGDGDLFGRKEEDENNIIKITSVDILLKIEENDITVIDRNKLAVLINSNNDYRLLKFDKPTASFTFKGESLKNPFNPEFTVLLKKDTPGPGGSGSFKIKKEKGKEPKFNFRLYVTAETALEYTKDL